VNYEAWNRYLLIAIGLFAVVLYFGLMSAGVAEFISRISKGTRNKKHSRNRMTVRRWRSGKVRGD
jgi:hypothetical protein